VVRWGGAGLTVAICVLWFGWLRPQSLGGRAGYVIVSGRSMLPTMHGGDLAMVRSQTRYAVGDVVAYRIPQGDAFAGRRIIHRIVGGEASNGFVMRGDNNAEPDLWHPRASDIEGRLWWRAPAFGRAIAFARSPFSLAAVAGGVAFALALTWPRPGEGRDVATASGGPSSPS
jgi:signal peptidase